MRFMVVEKTRLTFPALISKVFDSNREAQSYGNKKPIKNQAEVFWQVVNENPHNGL
jgi:hypothetical protein